MNAIERRHKILEQLEENSPGYTTELAEKLDATPMTIYRDLQALEKQGLVVLVRGGAILNRGTALLYGLKFRQMKMPLEKMRIAEYCANLASDGMTVFIDCGSTAEKIAENLRAKKIITLTTSLSVANILAESENKLIILPGVYEKILHGFSGQLTADFMSRFFVDKMFLGANGIDAHGFLTSPSLTDAETKRALIKCAREIIVAADCTKLDKSFFEVIARPKEINLLVTDSGADKNLLAEFQKRGLNVAAV